MKKMYFRSLDAEMVGKGYYSNFNLELQDLEGVIIYTKKEDESLKTIEFIVIDRDWIEVKEGE